MKKYFPFYGILLFSLIISLPLTTGMGCHRSNTLYSPSPIAVPSKTSNQRVQKAIEKSLKSRGWKIEKNSPGTVTARIFRGQIMAQIKVSYTKDNVQIDYLDSENLFYKEKAGEKQIHSRYNGWIKNLERDIQINLTVL